MTDATLIAADASLNSLIHNDTDEADKEAESQLRDRGLKDGSSARRVSNQTHTSRTDPDATLAQKKGTPRQLKYKVHQSIDADSCVSRPAVPPAIIQEPPRPRNPACIPAARTPYSDAFHGTPTANRDSGRPMCHPGA